MYFLYSILKQFSFFFLQEKNELDEKMRAQLEHLSEAEDRCEALIEQKIEIDGKLRELQERLEDEEELNNEMVIFKIDIIHEN